MEKHSSRRGHRAAPEHRSQGGPRSPRGHRSEGGQGSTGRAIKSWVWALAPVFTLGFGTAGCMAWAAAHTRSWVQGVLSVVYMGSTALVLVFDPDVSSIEEKYFSVGMTINMLFGATHAVVIRSWVFGTRTDTKPLDSLESRQDAALQDVRDAAKARERAWKVVREDPALAKELSIGRPDIDRRAFPDGGLLDVNNASADAIGSVTGLPSTSVARIVELRKSLGGFTSVEDMSVTLELPPRGLEHVRDRLIFLPYVDQEPPS